MINYWFTKGEYYTFGPPFFYIGLTRDKFEYIHCEIHIKSQNDGWLQCKVLDKEFIMDEENYDIIMDNKLYYYGFDYTFTTS